MGLSITTFSNSCSFQASAPLKILRMDSFPKTIASLNSYRNARITTTLNLLTSWTLHILYNISHWQLRILASPPSAFSAPKKLSLGATAPSAYPPATNPLVAALVSLLHDREELPYNYICYL